MSNPESPEAIAYQLYRDIADAEGRSFKNGSPNSVSAEWILRTYGTCLNTVKMPINTKDYVRALAERS